MTIYRLYTNFLFEKDDYVFAKLPVMSRRFGAKNSHTQVLSGLTVLATLLSGFCPVYSLCLTVVGGRGMGGLGLYIIPGMDLWGFALEGILLQQKCCSELTS